MCTRCGAALRPSDRFCAACGAPAATNEGGPPRQPAVSAERKFVTLLFADTVDSTRLIEDVDPEVAMARLQPVLDVMASAVHAYDGTISKLLGDGVLAVFGAPVAREDHAVRAAYAALRLLRDTPPGIMLRVGLHSGEVLLRTIETDFSVDYTALGPPVHLASRVERMAAPGEALATAATADLIRGLVETEPLGPRVVRGLDEPVEVHHLLRRTSAVGTWTPRVRRDLTRFIGRDRELAALRDGLRSAMAGAGRLTAIVGEAGVGKSRLVHEYLTGRPATVAVRRLQASPYDTSTPYHPLIPQFRDGPPDDGNQDADTIRARVTAAVTAIDPSLVAVVDPLIAMVGGQPDTVTWTALDPPRRRRSIRDAVRTVVLTAARHRPQVIVVEDLHWIDEDTQAVLDDLAEVADGVAVHLVVTYRPEYRDRWAGRPHHTLVPLDPLRGAAAAELVDAVLGNHPSVMRLRNALLTRTDGTPLFVEETIHSLADSGALSGAAGAYRFIGDPDALALPGTVQAVVAARVDRLTRADKQLLQVASVIGETVPLDVLTATSDLDDTAVSSGSRRLRSAQFLYELEAHSALTFKHNLIREVVYAEIPRDRRRRLHGAVCDVLVKGSSAVEAPIERLAHHAYNAERWDDAVRYLRQAAMRSEERSAYPQARRLLTMGLDAADRVPASPENLVRRIDMALALRVAATGSGQRLRGALVELDRAMVLAERLGDRRRLAMVAVHRSYVGSLTGDHRLAVTAARAAQRLGRELEDRYLLAEGRLAEGQALGMAGHPTGVPELLGLDDEYLRTSVGNDRRGQTTTRSVSNLTYMAVSHAQMGAFAEARRIMVERGAIARAGGRPFDLAFGCWGNGVIELYAGDARAAKAHFDEGIEISALHDLLYTDALICSQLGAVQHALGETDVALRTFERAIELARVLESPLITAWARVHRAAAHLARGARAPALADAEAALAFARQHDHPLLEATALRPSAAAADDPMLASALLRQAAAICERKRLVALRRQLGRDLGDADPAPC